jgi:hypothetical protein
MINKVRIPEKRRLELRKESMGSLSVDVITTDTGSKVSFYCADKMVQLDSNEVIELINCLESWMSIGELFE